MIFFSLFSLYIQKQFFVFKIKYSIFITLYLLGNVSILAKELYRQKRYGTVKSLIKGNGAVATPGDETLMGLHVDEDRSLVSVITMIFPSPDWFLGVSNVDMCDPMTGEWREEYSRDLFPYDSGTDDGTSFGSPDAPTMPKKNIFLIRNEDDTNFKSDSEIKRLGTFKFSKVPTKKCKGKAYYTLTFNAEWSNETHPSPVFPTNAMFSPLIGATHNLYYEMWRRGKMASTAVRHVAETGMGHIRRYFNLENTWSDNDLKILIQFRYKLSCNTTNRNA